MKPVVLKLLLMGVAFWSLAGAAAVDESDLSPWDSWRMGYTSYEQGESLRDRGEYTRAHQAFEAALKHYSSVKKARPDWNQKVIDERIEDCRRELTKTARLLGKSLPDAAAGPEASPGNVAPIKSENEVLRQQLAASGVELAKLRAELEKKRNLESEVANLIRDQRVAAEKYALLERRLQTVSRGGGVPDQRLNEVNRQLVNERLKYSALQKQFLEIQSELAKSKEDNDDLRRARMTAENSLRDSGNELKRLDSELVELRKFQSVAVERETALSGRLSEARRQTEAAVRRTAELENELSEIRQRLYQAMTPEGEAIVNSAILDENSSLHKKLDEIRSQLEEAIRESARQRSRHDILQEQHKLLAESLQRTENARRELERQLAETQKALADSGHSGTSSEAGQQAVARYEKLEADFKAITERCAELEERLARRASQDFQNLTAAQKQLNRLNSDFDKAQLELVSLRSERDSLKLEQERLSKSATAAADENQRLISDLNTVKQQLLDASTALDKMKNVSDQFAELRKNFAALKAENDENRLLAEAAKPREAELSRIKLRLAELEQLKARLGSEQRLNSELLAEKRRLENALAATREMESELLALKRKTPEIESMKAEIERLKALNTELISAKNTEGDLARLKSLLVEAESAQGELIRAKKLNEELLALQASQAEELNALKGVTMKYGSLKDDFNRIQAEYTALSNLKKQYSEVLAELDTARNEAEKYQREISRLNKYHAELERLRLLESGSQEIEKLRSELAERRVAAAESDKLAAELTALKQQQPALLVKARAGRELEVQNKKLDNDMKRLNQELETLQKNYRQMVAQADRLRSETLSQKNKLLELTTLQEELGRLKTLNRELVSAKGLEGEVAELKRKLSESEQIKDELGRVNRLNSELVATNEKLEQELTLRRRSLIPGVDLAGDPDTILPTEREQPEDLVAAGIIAESDGNLELAIWNYRKALKLDQNCTAAALRLGTIMFKREDFEAAAALLSMARAADPGNVELGLAAADSCLRLGRGGNAQAIVEPLLKNHPENYRLQVTAARALAATGQLKKAEERMTFAMRLAPRELEPKIELARLIAINYPSRLEEAARIYEKARLLGAAPDLELEPILGEFLDKRRETALFLAEAAAEAEHSRDWKAATWYYRQLNTLGRDADRFVPRLAYALYRDGSGAAALETLGFSSSVTPLGELVAMLVHYKNKDIPQAVQASRRALSLNGGVPVAVPEDWNEFQIELESTLSDVRQAPVRILREAFVKL